MNRPQDATMLPASVTGYTPNSRPTTRVGLSATGGEALSKLLAAEVDLVRLRDGAVSATIRLDSEDLTASARQRRRAEIAGQAYANIGIGPLKAVQAIAAEADGVVRQFVAAALIRRNERSPARQALFGEIRQVLSSLGTQTRSKLILQAIESKDCDVLESLDEWSPVFDTDDATRLHGTMVDRNDRGAVNRAMLDAVWPDRAQLRDELAAIVRAGTTQVSFVCSEMAAKIGVQAPDGTSRVLADLAARFGNEWSTRDIERTQALDLQRKTQGLAPVDPSIYQVTDAEAS